MSPMIDGDTAKNNYVYRKYLVEFKIWRKRVLNRHVMPEEIAITMMAVHISMSQLSFEPFIAACGCGGGASTSATKSIIPLALDQIIRPTVKGRRTNMMKIKVWILCTAAGVK